VRAVFEEVLLEFSDIYNASAAIAALLLLRCPLQGSQRQAGTLWFQLSLVTSQMNGILDSN